MHTMHQLPRTVLKQSVLGYHGVKLGLSSASRNALAVPSAIRLISARSDLNAPRGGAPDVSSFFREDIPLSSDAQRWFDEHKPKEESRQGQSERSARTSVKATNPDTGNLEPEPLYSEQQRGPGEHDKKEPQPDRDDDPYSMLAEWPAVLKEVPGIPKALGTHEYWRSDIPISPSDAAPPDRTMQPESRGDPGYQ